MEGDHTEYEEEARKEFSRGIEEKCRDAEDGPEENIEENNVPVGPSCGEEAVMEMLAGGAPVEGGMAGECPARRDNEAVCEGDAEGEEGGGDLSSGVDGQDAEHEAEEHGAGISHQDARKLKIEN